MHELCLTFIDNWNEWIEALSASQRGARLRASSWRIFVIMWLCGKTHSRLEWWMLVIINKRYESISCGKQVTTVVHLPVFELFLATLMHQSGVEMLIWYHRPGSEEDHNVNAVKRSRVWRLLLSLVHRRSSERNNGLKTERRSLAVMHCWRKSPSGLAYTHDCLCSGLLVVCSRLLETISIRKATYKHRRGKLEGAHACNSTGPSYFLIEPALQNAALQTAVCAIFIWLGQCGVSRSRPGFHRGIPIHSQLQEEK